MRKGLRLVGALFILAIFIISLMVIMNQASILFQNKERIDLQKEIIKNSEKIEANLKRDIEAHEEAIKLHTEEMKRRKKHGNSRKAGQGWNLHG